MARISEDTIERVAAASDVVDVIGNYLQLKRAGANWKGLCPFHNEKTPSLHVNPARQTFKCFGCGEGGSVFRFITQYENVDFPTAVRRLAARAGIPIAEESEGDQVKRGEKDRLLVLHRDATAWFHENLMRQRFAAPAREYLKGRGFDSVVAARWRLGYAPESWDALIGMLQGKKYSNEEIIRSGLVSVKEEVGARPYDRFRNRVMFPICNDFGDVIGFSGRTLGDDPAKYVNSPETPIFTKGRVLFGLEKSKRAIIDANEAVVCEGQLDMIAAFEAGVQNVTAPQGTAFTAQQARLLRRFGESVVLCFDSDAAGRKAVERSLPALLAVGLSVRVARVPAGEDPDSLVRKHGADALRAVIVEARDYFDDTLADELVPGATPRQRANLARKLAGFVKLIEDSALREAVTARVRARLGLTDAAFAGLVKSAPLPNAERESGFEPEEAVETLELPPAAGLLCRLAILSPDARAWMRDRPESAATFGSAYKLVDHIRHAEGALEDPAVFGAFVATLSAAEERALTGLHLGKPLEGQMAAIELTRELGRAPDKSLAVSSAASIWSGLLRQQLAKEMTALQALMRHPDTPLEEVGSLHKQILDLQKRLGQV